MLIVGALLLCHGVLGFAHAIYCHECGSSELLTSAPSAGHEHGARHPAGHAADHDPSGGHAFTGYFGIVLALFGAAVLGVLFGLWGWRGVAGPRLYRPRSLPVLARLPRGPTFPLLQVFRL